MGITIAEKDIPNKQNLLGQFFTDDKIASLCVDAIPTFTDYIVEPSCGNGVFLDKIRLKKSTAKIMAIELDPEVIADYTGSEKISVMNFYDFSHTFSDPVCFIGNPPYHSPAYSLSERPLFVKSLMKKYSLTNIREESVIFFVWTIDLIIKSGVKGYINYIMPKAVFDNNSKAYLSFRKFLKQYLKLVQVVELDKCFKGVNRDLVFVSFETGSGDDANNYYLHKSLVSEIAKRTVGEFYNELDYIPFQKMFKRTNLGSVPCESIFLSIHDEPINHFMKRMYSLFICNVDISNLLSYLKFNGEAHLTALKNNSEKKLQVIMNYVEEIKKLPNFDVGLFNDLHNYKPIQHRNGKRWYFRHKFLKKASFVYELNRDPCPSFYFPGNPNKGSTDYFGYCEYDVNRNSSPGANRTIPLENIEENLQPEFKIWWDNNCGLPYKCVFEYLLYISKSEWYKNLKKTCQRFYFGIPKQFDVRFLKT
jgi:hypothetical protein